MTASKCCTGSTQRAIFVAFLVFLAVLQFSALIEVSGARKTLEISTDFRHWRDHNTTQQSSNTTPSSSCMHVLGKSGTWIQDWDFAEHYGQYSSPLVIPPGPHARSTWGKFQPSRDAPFRWESSWKWHDYSAEDCQIDYIVSAEKLRDVLHRLQVTRVLFFGDSLTQSQAKALLNKLGSDHVKTTLPKPSNTTNMYELQCSNKEPNQHPIQFLLAKEGGGHGSRSNPTRLNFPFHKYPRSLSL